MPSMEVHRHRSYLITDEGNVIACKSNTILKPRINYNGYQIVALDREQLSVHRLVATHFIPNPYELPEVNHKDGDKTNNHVSNLEWVSRERNVHHALETGLRSGYVPYDTKLAFLHRALAGELIADLANEIPGIHPNTLSKMLRTTAQKERLESDWKAAMKIRRVNVAIKNLSKINN